MKKAIKRANETPIEKKFSIFPIYINLSTCTPIKARDILHIPSNIHAATTRIVAHRIRNPALARLKFTLISIALLKFVPRISAPLEICA